MERQPSITPLLKTARPHACAPLTAWLGVTSREALLLHGPFCWDGSSPGLEAHVKESDFPSSLPPKQLLPYRKIHFSAPLPLRPDLGGGFGGCTTAGVPLLPSCPLPVHHPPLREGIRKSCCFGWIKILTFCPKLTTCCKTGGSDGKEEKRAFPERSLSGGSWWRCKTIQVWNVVIIIYELPCTLSDIAWDIILLAHAKQCNSLASCLAVSVLSLNGAFRDLFPACGSQRPKRTMRDQRSALNRGSMQSSIPAEGFLGWFITKESLACELHTRTHTW